MPWKPKLPLRRPAPDSPWRDPLYAAAKLWPFTLVLVSPLSRISWRVWLAGVIVWWAVMMTIFGLGFRRIYRASKKNRAEGRNR